MNVIVVVEEIIWGVGYIDGLKGFFYILIMCGKGESRNRIVEKLDNSWLGN